MIMIAHTTGVLQNSARNRGSVGIELEADGEQSPDMSRVGDVRTCRFRDFVMIYRR